MRSKRNLLCMATTSISTSGDSEVAIGEGVGAGTCLKVPNTPSPDNVTLTVTPIVSTQRQSLVEEGVWKVVTTNQG